MIALRCSFHATVRSGSVGLPRALHGLTTDSACAGLRRTFEVFRIASSTNQHCCRVIIDPLFGSPTEPPSCCPDRLTPASSPGVGPVVRVAPNAWPHRPSVGFAPSCEGPSARPLPATNRGPSPSASGCQSGSPVPTTWFLTTSPGFSAQRRAGLLHPAADHGVRHVSHGPAEASRDPRDATTPRRTLPSTRGTPVTRSPGPRGVRPCGIRPAASLLMQPSGSLRGRHLRGIIREDGL